MLPTIEKTMIIGEIVSMFPEAAEVIQGYGVHCVGCHANAYETLEQGILGHGFSEDELQDLVDELNEYIQDINANGGDPNKLPPEADQFKIHLTPAAINQIKSVIKKDKKDGVPLKVTIQVIAGVYKYGINFLEGEKSEFDKIFEYENGTVLLAADKRDYKKFRDLEIDFVKEEDRAGFKMNNPNQKI